jgi:hypothetical protein
MAAEGLFRLLTRTTSVHPILDGGIRTQSYLQKVAL